MDFSFFNILAAGGDAATIVLVWALWKFDRRILRLEIVAGINSKPESD